MKSYLNKTSTEFLKLYKYYQIFLNESIVTTFYDFLLLLLMRNNVKNKEV